MEIIEGGPGGATWWDKVPSKFAGWGANHFRAAGFRAVPGSIVRRGAYISKGAVMMPSFVNIGAPVGDGSMVDRSDERRVGNGCVSTGRSRGWTDKEKKKT